MSNPLDFSGKLALVTGAASGMGLATAKAFAEAGAAAQTLVAAGRPGHHDRTSGAPQPPRQYHPRQYWTTEARHGRIRRSTWM